MTRYSLLLFDEIKYIQVFKTQAKGDQKWYHSIMILLPLLCKVDQRHVLKR